jgi:phosphoserine phosphatase
VQHRAWLEPRVAVDLFHDQPLDRATLPQECDAITQRTKHRRKTLLISDMDSTLIEQECIDELADYLGIKAQVATITERAMNGELDFKDALRERVGLLKGLPESALQEVYDSRITLMSGARTLVQTMRAQGAYCLLVSGGFTFFTRRIAERLGFHDDHANQLDFVEGRLSGQVIEPILDKESKLQSLLSTAAQRGMDAIDALAVGDGANDLPMLLAAGLGVAYHAKPVVQQSAQAALNHNDLSALLFVQGYARSEWVA